MEDVRLDLVELAPGEDAAHLRFLAEGEDVRLDAHRLVAPERARRGHAGLHLVEDQERVVLVGEVAEGGEERGAQVAVAALALDRLDEDAGDVVSGVVERLFGLRERAGLAAHRLRLVDAAAAREEHGRTFDARPREFREAGDLARVGVRQRHRVARAPVEGVLEVEHLVPDLAAVALRVVLLHLVVEGGLQGVLDGERAALHEEGVRQVLGDADAGERVDHPGHVGRVDVGVGDLVERRLLEPREERRIAGEGRVVDAERHRGVEAEEIEVRAPGDAVGEAEAERAVEVEHERQPVGEQMPPDGRADVRVVGRCGRGRGEGRQFHRCWS